MTNNQKMIDCFFIYRKTLAIGMIAAFSDNRKSIRDAARRIHQEAFDEYESILAARPHYARDMARRCIDDAREVMRVSLNCAGDALRFKRQACDSFTKSEWRQCCEMRALESARNYAIIRAACKFLENQK